MLTNYFVDTRYEGRRVHTPSLPEMNFFLQKKGVLKGKIKRSHNDSANRRFLLLKITRYERKYSYSTLAIFAATIIPKAKSSHGSIS